MKTIGELAKAIVERKADSPERRARLRAHEANKRRIEDERMVG